ncbi:rRNA maturation RNase YbeY [Paenibacillus dauci]|uniref:rRNA maturation RNase YbeY n=1 Tax=Paenibacillus dauci TaxID=1567106 RepID=UPI0006192272|nr:rRNA maturation RNase YbeY [Paenibacillus dauci]
MSLQLAWENEQTEYEIKGELISLLEQILQKAGEQEAVQEGEVALTFVDDETIHQLNKEYRNIDRPTDVLSFAMHESMDDEMEINYGTDSAADGEQLPGDMLGDIIISIPRAIAQSEDYGHSVEREIGFLFVHGFLHLLGYDHQDDATEAEMMGKQEAVLEQIGLTR